MAKEQELAERLKERARAIGHSPYFWELMAQEILDGKVKGLDPRVHIKNPKSPEVICEEIHTILGSPGGAMTKELRVLYLTIMKSVISSFG